jgi:hypothetical protein
VPVGKATPLVSLKRLDQDAKRLLSWSHSSAG